MKTAIFKALKKIYKLTKENEQLKKELKIYKDLFIKETIYEL